MHDKPGYKIPAQDSQRLVGAAKDGTLDCIMNSVPLKAFTPSFRTTQATFTLSVVSNRLTSPQMFLFKASYLVKATALTCWLKSKVEKHLCFIVAIYQVMYYMCVIIPHIQSCVIHSTKRKRQVNLSE